MTGALSEKKRLDWLQLIRTESIGPISFFRLLKKFGSAEAAIDALPRVARAVGRAQPPAPADRDACARELALADELGVRTILACEPDYPRLLRTLPDRPPVLYAKGHPNLFERPAVAIIGARNASGVGRKIARDLAQGLGAEGVVVVSGLARGIDGTAHAAALQTGTIAVVAGGVDVIYPPEHADLTLEIAARGLLVSERALGHQPTARDFPRRNRLISGLARGVVVVEAAAKSGTLITARFALDQGREVFAVPGSPLDPRCQGANRLIREGAILVETAEDILEVLAAQAHSARETGPDDLFGQAGQAAQSDEAPDAAPPELRAAIFELLSFTPLHRDEILRAADAPPGLIADALLELVLAGEAEELPGGTFARAGR